MVFDLLKKDKLSWFIHAKLAHKDFSAFSVGFHHLDCVLNLGHFLKASDNPTCY